jgi:ATP-binding cassette subfamily F protein uup
LRGDKIGLLGPNGIGKTTLLKLILGDIEADSGKVERGTKINVAYFDQMREQLDEDATLADTISPGSDFVEIGNERKHVISYLEDFLFPPQRSRSPVKSLSGGERNRLLLARLFARPANVLVLDEPTNDLDIDTLELLESLLQEFAGTLFLVSHDRAFLENTVTQVIAFEGNGVLTEFGGGYDDWQRFTQQRLEEKKSQQTQSLKNNTKPNAISQVKPASKLSFKEEKALAEIPMQIEKLELEQTDINNQLVDSEIYKTQATLAKNLQARLIEIDGLLEKFLARWEELDARNN